MRMLYKNAVLLSPIVLMLFAILETFIYFIYFIIAMYVYHLGLYCILSRKF